MCIILILEIIPQHMCIFFSSRIKKLINYEGWSLTVNLEIKLISFTLDISIHRLDTGMHIDAISCFVLLGTTLSRLHLSENMRENSQE